MIINELVGIINGIDFDGVINEDEIKCLQKWADKNRNLVYDSKQVEIIKQLDSLLEDHVYIDEKQKLLFLCEDYLHDSPDEIAKIYELKGIIEGIVCDDVLNAKEIIQLKKWLDNNRSYLKDYESAESLRVLVEDILDDGVVTELEQESLLAELTKRLDDSHLQLKIAHLKQLVKNQENLGIDLIDLLDNDEAIGEIHSKAEKELFTNNSHTEKVCCSLKTQ